MKKILGISAYYHDSAAAIIVGGEIVAAAQEERFTRNKHTPDFPFNSIKFCLEYAGIELDQLDAVVFYDKPLLKFERLLSTYYAFSPHGLISFLKSMTIWVSEKIFLKQNLRKELAKIGNYNKKKLPILFTEHHLSHAASSFYVSKFEESAILTIDGVGEYVTASIGIGNSNGISMLRELNFPHSVGLLYSSLTYFLGFTVNSGEYKVMGLAPYGILESDETNFFINQIKKEVVSIKEDGSIWLNQKYFDYSTGLKMIKIKKWEKLLGIPQRNPETQLLQCYCNLALAIQVITEEIVLLMVKEVKRITGMKNLCMAGGVALNCVANGKILKEKIFDNIYIQPASGDAGCAIGAALAISQMYFSEDQKAHKEKDAMNGCYLGPEYREIDIIKTINKFEAKAEKFENFDLLCKYVAEYLNDGSVVGWFQGRMEFGPRALGNRSILGDPRNTEMQKTLNLKIKQREGFRPFAPAVLAEHVNEYFDLEIESPYMMFVSNVTKKYRNTLPADYASHPLIDKLYFNRSSLPAITHLDFSARVQTVHKETNPKFNSLLKAFYNLTSCPVLVNTSFNVRGEPIVMSPLDAYACFMNTDMDFLVIENFLFKKTDQKDWNLKEKWKTIFKMD
jgi:carbamoyltransferase